jgi:hypothetical protein
MNKLQETIRAIQEKGVLQNLQHMDEDVKLFIISFTLSILFLLFIVDPLPPRKQCKSCGKYI